MQRYKILKAIHNITFKVFNDGRVFEACKDTKFWKRFTTSVFATIFWCSFLKHAKIQNFESDSQLVNTGTSDKPVFEACKDTKFWKRFTTIYSFGNQIIMFLKHAKIQNFESDSQQSSSLRSLEWCFWSMQRYKILKAIHNFNAAMEGGKGVFEACKDTKFWKRFTTLRSLEWFPCRFLKHAKIQNFESDSQHSIPAATTSTVFEACKDTKFWKRFTT